MDRKQKEQLRFYLKARKRADKVLEARREALQKKQDHARRSEANQALLARYTGELTALAEACGILRLARQAADARGGSLRQEVSYYMDYGMANSNFQRAFTEDTGQLRASHLTLRITWIDGDAVKTAEIRVHANGQVRFHNKSWLPVLPVMWRWRPQLLHAMLDSALNHPRTENPPAKSG